MLLSFQLAVLIQIVIIFAHAQAPQLSPMQSQPKPVSLPVQSSPPMLSVHDNSNNNVNNNNINIINNNSNSNNNNGHTNRIVSNLAPKPSTLTEPQITNALPSQPSPSPPPPALPQPQPTSAPQIQLSRTTAAQFSSPQFSPSTASFIPSSSVITIDVSQPPTIPTSAPQAPTKPTTVSEDIATGVDQGMPHNQGPGQKFGNLTMARELFDVTRSTDAPAASAPTMRFEKSTTTVAELTTASPTTIEPTSSTTELIISSTTPTPTTKTPTRVPNLSPRGSESKRLIDNPPASSNASLPVQFLKPKSRFRCMQESDCLNGAICRNGTCFCPPGYTGDTCAINIDECRQVEEPCFNNGICIDEINTFRCDCAPGFKGDRCQESIDMCANAPCLNGAKCVNHRTDYTCECEPGWEGKDCEKNINECLKNPCQNNSTCVDLINDYKCECGSSGFTGKNCDVDFDDCAARPCGFGSKECVDLTGDFKCICYDGFTGKKCDIDIDECQPNPCENNGTCYQKSSYLHHLHNQTTDIPIYHDIREQNNSSIINMSQYAGYSCECKEEYHGDRCEERKKCYTKSVHELCNHQQAECVNIGNSYECLVSASFDGTGQSFATYKVIGEFKMREIYVKYRSLTGGIIMSFETTQSESPDLQLNKSGLYLSGSPIKRDENIKFDELLDGNEREIRLGLDTPTEIKGITLARNDYNSPFKGCLMQVRLNNQLVPLVDYDFGTNHSFEFGQNNLDVGHCRTCFDKDCLNNGHCEIRGEGYDHCACPNTFTGDFCEIDVNECEKNFGSCLNGGTCENLHGGYRCNCKEGFRGEKCQEISDYCKAKQPCMNSGICKNVIPNQTNQGKYECECPSAYVGKRCERKRDCHTECHNLHAQCISNVTCACLPGKREERIMCEYISSCEQVEGELCLNGGTCKNLETGGYQCICQEPFYGPICQFLTEKPQLDVILWIVVTCVGLLMAACAVVSLFIFRSVRKARATRGTYSPSTQEKFGNSASDLLKPPEPELLI